MGTLFNYLLSTRNNSTIPLAKRGDIWKVLNCPKTDVTHRLALPLSRVETIVISCRLMCVVALRRFVVKMMTGTSLHVQDENMWSGLCWLDQTGTTDTVESLPSSRCSLCVVVLALICWSWYSRWKKKTAHAGFGHDDVNAIFLLNGFVTDEDLYISDQID